MTSESPGERLAVMITIPFWSNLGYLAEASQSLVAQTDRDWTAIVVDDASPEHGAAELVAALADPRLSYVRNDVNLGVAGNFNRCFELAEGIDIVTIFHADDLLEPGYVKAIRRAHAEHPEAACVAPKVTVIDADGEPTRTIADTVKAWLWPRADRVPVLHGEAGLRRLLRGQFFYCPAVSYRLELLPDLRWDTRWQQVMDLDLYGRILLGGESIVLVDEQVYRYRRHLGTMTEANSASFRRTAEENVVLGELALVASQRRWHRAARAARWRPGVRGQALLRSIGRLRPSRVSSSPE